MGTDNVGVEVDERMGGLSTMVQVVAINTDLACGRPEQVQTSYLA